MEIWFLGLKKLCYKRIISIITWKYRFVKIKLRYDYAVSYLASCHLSQLNGGRLTVEGGVWRDDEVRHVLERRVAAEQVVRFVLVNVDGRRPYTILL